MAGDGLDTETINFLFAHAGKEIPLGIVGAQMLGAQPMAVVKIVSGLGHVKLGFRATAKSRANMRSRGCLARLVRLYADIVAEFRPVCRVLSHFCIMGRDT